eukprot:TRINITY_DN9598_c0_g1_i1.p1 TRINITY_DN9598_c0_g1~~TRINITY_DN9598_c0_g1_i1.p1  ORF type:complete len:296 (+),score=86.01 TRINITY_DN9598_c0_g1_i1:27-914(+)
MAKVFSDDNKSLFEIFKEEFQKDDYDVSILVECAENLSTEEVNNRNFIYGGSTPISRTIWEDIPELLDALIEREDIDINEPCTEYEKHPPLGVAITANNFNYVQKLINAGADVNLEFKDKHYTWNILAYAFQKGNDDIINLIIHQDNIKFDAHFGNDWTMLGISISHGNIEYIKIILENDADVNEKFRGFTPLGFSLYKGDSNIIKLLLDQENIDLESKSKFDRYEYSPLGYCIAKGKVDIAIMLLENGASFENINDDIPETYNTRKIPQNYLESKNTLIEYLNSQKKGEKCVIS